LHLPINTLTCHAPHPDPSHAGEACGTRLGDVPGRLEFVTTAARAPHIPDGRVRLRCPRRGCGMWNVWQLVPVDQR
jgi:hypothetical protein